MSIKMRYYDGGGVGYEEDPMPGVQTDREDAPKKSFKRDGSRVAKSRPRAMSSEEFLREYEKSAPSERIRGEASKSVRKGGSSRVESGTRADFGGVSFGDPEMTREEQARIAKGTVAGAATHTPVGRAVAGAKAMKKTYDIGKNVERMPLRKQQTAFLRAYRESKEVDGMKFGGLVRGSGCEIRGKSKGRTA
jgi:hypothetical protein